MYVCKYWGLRTRPGDVRGIQTDTIADGIPELMNQHTCIGTYKQIHTYVCTYNQYNCDLLFRCRPLTRTLSVGWFSLCVCLCSAVIDCSLGDFLDTLLYRFRMCQALYIFIYIYRDIYVYTKCVVEFWLKVALILLIIFTLKMWRKLTFVGFSSFFKLDGFAGCMCVCMCSLCMCVYVL